MQVGQHHITSKALDTGSGSAPAQARRTPEEPPAQIHHLPGRLGARGVQYPRQYAVFARLEPNAAICLDITSACDTPDLNMRYDIALGKGPQSCK